MMRTISFSWYLRWGHGWLGLLGLLLTPILRGEDENVALVLAAKRGAPTDLEVVGDSGEGFLSWDALVSLGVEEIESTFEVTGDPRRLGVVRLAKIVAALGVSQDELIVSADCNDNYWSYFDGARMKRFEPYLVVSIDGEPISEWATGKERPDWGPYWLSVENSEGVRDASHMRPWGVHRVRFQREAWLRGALKERVGDSPEIQVGMEIYLGSCASCHQLDALPAGGTLSTRTAQILAVHAQFNESYFRAMLADPVGTNPAAARMPAKTEYSESEVQSLIAFLKAYGHQ